MKLFPQAKNEGDSLTRTGENKNLTNEKQASGGRRTYKQITEDMPKIIDGRDEGIKELKGGNRKLKKQIKQDHIYCGI